MMDIIERLLNMCRDIRRKPIPVSGVIPLMQEASADLARLRAENEALKAENAALASWQCLFTDGTTGLYHDGCGNAQCARDHLVVHLTAEVEALRADAERYRWLRDTDGNVNILRDDGKFSLPDWQGLSFTWRRRAWQDGKPFVVCDGLDAAIDAAMAQGKV